MSLKSKEALSSQTHGKINHHLQERKTRHIRELKTFSEMTG